MAARGARDRMSDGIVVRARSFAESDPLRGRILEFLGGEAREHLIAAAERGRVPIGEISQVLLDRFGREALASRTTRQFIGLAVGAVLAEAGYKLVRSGIRLPKDPLFAAGSLFRKVEEPVLTMPSLLERVINQLSPEELKAAAELIKRRLRS